MDTAHTPLHFFRFNRPLRALRIDREAWFAAKDFGLLLGHRHPERICNRLDADQLRTVSLVSSTGSVEEVQMISESGAYHALYRFHHPEHCNLRRWLAESVLSVLKDSDIAIGDVPAKLLMRWAEPQVPVLSWQGELWIPLAQVPAFYEQSATQNKPSMLSRFFHRR